MDDSHGIFHRLFFGRPCNAPPRERGLETEIHQHQTAQDGQAGNGADQRQHGRIIESTLAGDGGRLFLASRGKQVFDDRRIVILAKFPRHHGRVRLG